VTSGDLLGLLLPHLTGLIIDDVTEVGDLLRIDACSAADDASCPDCATESERVHDRYRRRLADLAVGGRRAIVMLVVRRFRCESASCPRWTFAEQIDGLTYRHGRRSVLQRRALEAIGLSLASKAGARLASRLGLTAAANTLLRLVDALPEPGRGPELKPGGRRWVALADVLPAAAAGEVLWRALTSGAIDPRSPKRNLSYIVRSLESFSLMS
jgi:hypothetical protein